METTTTCKYLVDRVTGIDDLGRPVWVHGHACGQPVAADSLCATHLNEACGL